jgi:nitroreductase
MSITKAPRPSSSLLQLACALALAAAGCGPEERGPEDPRSLHQRIINGDKCGESDQPASVAIIVDAKIEALGNELPIRSVLCTGTLIAPDTVLSAAHCVNPTLLTMGLGTVKDETYYVSFTADLGEMALDPFKLLGGQLPDLPDGAVEAGAWLAHPGFKVELLQQFQGGLGNLYDVALIFLKQPVTAVDPAVVITKEEAAQVVRGKEVTISGWGQQTAAPQNPLQPPEPGTIAVKVCAESFINEVGQYEMQIGGDASTSRKCHGDSGGPSFMEVETDHARNERVVGITSHAYDKVADCAVGGIDTRVDAWLDWIDSEMRKACKDKRRPWCEVEGIIPPSYYDPSEPDLGPDGTLLDAGGGGGDTSVETSDDGCGCALARAPRSPSWPPLLLLLPLVAFLQLLRARRSIRRYTDEPLTPELLEALQEALLRSPSSRGICPWEFVLIQDTELLEKLSRCKPHGASFLRDAALGIVVCGDETRSDVWVEDCSIASIVVQLAAHSLGLGSCWIQVRRRPHEDGGSAEAHIQALLDLPPHLRVLSMIAVGHPAQEKEGHPRGSLDWGKIHRR